MTRWLLAALLLFPATSFGEEDKEQDEDLFGDQSALEEEEEFPDLVRADETGGIIDELAFLEEELSADVVHSASKHLQSIFWSPSAITVFTRDDIRSSGATGLAALLRRVPGFDVYRLKPGFPLVGARALTEEANNLVLLLVDGREALAEFTGFAFWDSTFFNMEEVERVEVIRGPGSALYGANAFAAVVSVTTVTEKQPGTVRFNLTAGEYGQQRLFAKVHDTFEVGEGKLSFSAAASAEGVISPSDIRDWAFSQYRAHGYLRYWKKGEMDLSIQSGLVLGEGTMHLNIGDVMLGEGVITFFMGQATFALGESVRLKAQIYRNLHDCTLHYRTRLRAYDMWVANIPDFGAYAPVWDGQVQLDWQIGDSLLLIGGGNLRHSFLSGENAVIDEDTELRGAGFVNLQWAIFEELQLTGGLRFDFNTFSEPALSPRAVTVFRPWEGHAFRLGYGLAFRKPSIFESRCHIEILEHNDAFPEIVELGRTQFGNPDLINEKVHSVEAGWMANLLEERLRLSVDLFYNMYRDTITFVVDIPLRMGLPDISKSRISYENEGADVNALGGEVEVAWTSSDHWKLWGNLGLRHVTVEETGERMSTEPRLRVNLGGRYLPESGPLFDLALHYVSEYEMPLMDPGNILNEPELVPLGNRFLLIGRLGYRLTSGTDQTIEAGLIVRTPLGSPFREYAGVRMPQYLQIDVASDWEGVKVVRLLALYLRGTI
jgi:iron complex outermembrane receptor protein